MIATKGYFAFAKAPEPYRQKQDTPYRVSYLSTEMQSAYSIASYEMDTMTQVQTLAKAVCISPKANTSEILSPSPGK